MGTDVTLTLAEETTFAELEAVVERNRWAFVQAGLALAEIHLRRLYRVTHATFGSYCQERWGFKRSTAYAYLEASTVAVNVHSSGQTPPSLTQARELAVLEPEQQRAVAATTDFAHTTVKQLKGRIDGVRNPKAKRAAGNVHSSAQNPRGEILPPANEAPRPEPGMSMVRADALCLMCRERLFPQEAPKQDSAVDVEPTPIQTPVVERKYVADDAVPVDAYGDEHWPPADEEIVF
ncbi:hypothetical protein [Tunturiibacter gelidiferens]|uniref:hypothetical protein n=1 Tax=Tunturiibacter gelidiferens TaxID=3069689 RepID=UPI003D9B5764